MLPRGPVGPIILAFPLQGPGTPKFSPKPEGRRENPDGSEARDLLGDQGHDEGPQLLGKHRADFDHLQEESETLQGLVGE
eukprot:3287668-Pyramimonas_sp.AAC.1